MQHSLLSDLICMHVMDTLLVPANFKEAGHLKKCLLFQTSLIIFRKMFSFPYVLCSKVILGINKRVNKL